MFWADSYNHPLIHFLNPFQEPSSAATKSIESFNGVFDAVADEEADLFGDDEFKEEQGQALVGRSRKYGHSYYREYHGYGCRGRGYVRRYGRCYGCRYDYNPRYGWADGSLDIDEEGQDEEKG